MRTMPELEAVMLKTAELLEYTGNAKLHPAEQVDQIAASIEEFGFNSPVLAWHNQEGEPEIVAGHGRVMAARKLGIEELPVVFLDHMSDEQRRAYVLVDNQLTMNSGFDETILENELDAIVDTDMSKYDFDIPEQAEALGDEQHDGDDSYDVHASVDEQYGVIVYCKDENDQERTYNALEGDGMTCKVVAI